MAHEFSLSLAAVDMLLELGRLGPAPFPFRLPHVGTTHTQRAQVREAVFRDLESRGLMRGRRLDGDVEVALRAFTSAPIAVAAVGQLDDGKQLFARACSDGQFAVLVRQDENLLVFTETRPTGIVPALVDLLPLTPAAAGQSVTVAQPTPNQQRAHRSGDDVYDPFAGVAPPRSHATSQQRGVERIFEKPRKRVGQFTSFVRGPGNRQRVYGPTAWFDTEDGRYFMTMRAASDGQQWITYAPADNARLAQHLFEQLEGQFQT
jgi:hypothetical protein